MANELAVIEAINTIGKTINTYSGIVRSGRSLRKKELIILEEEIRYLKKQCHMKAKSALQREAADEMEKTYNHFMSKNFPAHMQVWLMASLESQFKNMFNDLDRY